MDGSLASLYIFMLWYLHTKAALLSKVTLLLYSQLPLNDQN